MVWRILTMACAHTASKSRPERTRCTPHPTAHLLTHPPTPLQVCRKKMQTSADMLCRMCHPAFRNFCDRYIVVLLCVWWCTCL